MVSTLGGTQKIEYPPNSQYHEIKIDYRAPYGTIFGSMVLFVTIAVFVWGGLGVCLRMMMDDQKDLDAVLVPESIILEAEELEEGSS